MKRGSSYYIVVMFLGGRLDHATRGVLGSLTVPGLPLDPVYHLPESGEGPAEAYIARKVEIEGKKPWWIYILDGYFPPRSHVLDTNPFPI